MDITPQIKFLCKFAMKNDNFKKKDLRTHNVDSEWDGMLSKKYQREKQRYVPFTADQIAPDIKKAQCQKAYRQNYNL